MSYRPQTDDLNPELRKEQKDEAPPLPVLNKESREMIYAWFAWLQPFTAGEPGWPDWAFNANAGRRNLITSFTDALEEAAKPKKTRRAKVRPTEPNDELDEE